MSAPDDSFKIGACYRWLGGRWERVPDPTPAIVDVPDDLTLSDLATRLDDHDVQRLTLRRPPGGSWLALAVTSSTRHVEAVGIGPTIAAALLDVLADLAKIEAGHG